MKLPLLFALIFPTLLTLAYFQWLQGSGFSQPVYAIGKCIQFGFPVVFVLWLDRSAPRDTIRHGASDELGGTPASNLILGTLFGIAVVAGMFLIYRYLFSDETTAQMQQMVQEKIVSMGLGSVPKFLAASLFYILAHSCLEEYYWRWFVFDRLEPDQTWWKAAVISSLGFMAHHVVLLACFFGWQSTWTYFLSASIAVGGFFWAWLYRRVWGFRSAWLSHAIVDAGIFGLGFWIVKPIL